MPGDLSKSGDCGCGSRLRTEQIDKGEAVGSDWTEIVQGLLSDGAKLAQSHLETLNSVSEGEVIVPVRITAFLRYGFKGARLQDAGLVGCVCTNDGTVCKCKGQCDFPGCCDGDAGTGPPIVAAVR